MNDRVCVNVLWSFHISFSIIIILLSIMNLTRNCKLQQNCIQCKEVNKLLSFRLQWQKLTSDRYFMEISRNCIFHRKSSLFRTQKIYTFTVRVDGMVRERGENNLSQIFSFSLCYCGEMENRIFRSLLQRDIFCYSRNWDFLSFLPEQHQRHALTVQTKIMLPWRHSKASSSSNLCVSWASKNFIVSVSLLIKENNSTENFTLMWYVETV